MAERASLRDRAVLRTPDFPSVRSRSEACKRDVSQATIRYAVPENFLGFSEFSLILGRSSCDENGLTRALSKQITGSRRKGPIMDNAYDVVVVGAGIAGCSVAAELAEHASVLVLEPEDQPGRHTTGRSAALFLLTYGNEAVRALTRASRDFFYSPPEDFCIVPLVKPRSVLVTARVGQEAAFDALMASIAPGDCWDRISAAQAVVQCPILRPERLVNAALSRTCADIEVHELVQGYLRRLKARGGIIATNSKVLALERTADRWAITTSRGLVYAGKVVNAAGAWADEIAKMAGAVDVSLRPLKRTACLVQPPAGSRSETWPMLADVEDQFYLKPDAGMLLLSPADETLTEPCDAQADEIDIAIAIDRIEAATTLQIRRVSHKWAGLRSFATDKSPVIGRDPVQPDFFWFAALGGFGIQTAPALGRLTASIVLDRPIDEDLVACGVEAEILSPSRFLPRDLGSALAPVAESRAARV